MRQSTLAKSPQFLEATLKLIENSFEYDANNSFDMDFAPLVQQNNLHNCHIILNDQNEVIAHIGCLIKELKFAKWSHPVLFIGGIAVDKKFRGQGIFKKLFSHILEHYHHRVAMFMLWSDQVAMYNRFGFYPAIDQFAYENKKSTCHEHSFKQVKISELSIEDQEDIHFLYESYPAWQCDRAKDDWKVINNMESAELYIRRNKDGHISEYFFKGKGADLQGVIHEANLSGQQASLAELQEYGTLWSNLIVSDEARPLYGSVVKIGDPAMFSDFVYDYTQRAIEILEINESTIRFRFQDRGFELNMGEALTGIFGPNRFEELNHLIGIRISGMDSI